MKDEYRGTATGREKLVGVDGVSRAQQYSWFFTCPSCGYDRICLPGIEYLKNKYWPHLFPPGPHWQCMKCFHEFDEEPEIVRTTHLARTESGPDGSSYRAPLA